MKTLFVVNRESDWPHGLPGEYVVTAKEYLTRAAVDNGEVERVINLCRCRRAQGIGFYVSLLAEARGHRPLPAARTLQALRGTPASVPLLKDLERRVQPALAHLEKDEVEIKSCFGTDPAGAHDAISLELFALLQAPLLHAQFRRRHGTWRLHRIGVLGLADVPEMQREVVRRAAMQFPSADSRPKPPRADRAAIAILHTPSEPLPPSNAAALEKMLRAAGELGMRAEVLGRHETRRLDEFDALFLRDTTYVGHYTYELSQKAAALGLVVIDDPDSILQCNNKVYLNELLGRHGIAVPRTLAVHRDNLAAVVPALGLPCILKQPDGVFSLGVRRAGNERELRAQARPLFERSALIVAQEFLPTAFDWRITVLDRRPLFVCKYFMAPGHWQVNKYEPDRHVEGPSKAFSVGETPQEVIDTALRAANLIGDGLYGVDLKQAGGRCVVMEINDNPNIDAGIEDELLKDALYRELMGVFHRRIGERREARAA